MQRYSECCSAPVWGEVDNEGWGRCSDCKEMSETWEDWELED